VTAAAAQGDWHAANQRALMREVARVQAVLERYAGHDAEPVRSDPAVPVTSALDVVCARFGLSPFERSVVVLCAAPELDGRFVQTLARANGGEAAAHPTFGLALAAFADAHWSALTPAAPLRRWRMVELGAGGITSAPLRIDEWLLHVLAGAGGLDAQLVPLLARLDAGEPTETQRRAASAIAAAWSGEGRAAFPTVQLHGAHAEPKRAAFAAACARLGWEPYAIDARELPANANDSAQLACAWEREATIGFAALLIDAHDAGEPGERAALARFVDRLSTPVAVATRGASRVARRPTFAIEVGKPSRREQRELWSTALGEPGARSAAADAIAGQFDLDAGAIGAVARAVSVPDRDAPEALWNGCRRATRGDLDEVAQRVDVRATLEDLVLPQPQRDVLGTIVAHVRHRVRVYEDWQMAGPSLRGLGTSALFAGPSGTGKTLAAEALANALSLDLYRIDLSQVVSKYIGETEKNLRRVFDAADEGGAVLLFDEADALFGKRSEVRDSHDRYANVEISYLLQRMESYRGLAVLTTNMRAALDPAFTRRLRFIVTFPFPDAAQREAIWRRMFPAAAPTEAIDYAKLARLTVSGGSIRNIAVDAAFLAAEDGTPVRMAHLLRAAVAEAAKHERPLGEAEIGGWT
jgi:ATPase family associated with various cellular activities (AAA)